MKIIEIAEYESPIYKKKESEIIEEGEYKYEKQYNFLPQFLEEIYDGRNADKLKDANNSILQYSKKRKELQYIASLKDRTAIVEYYYDKDCNIVAFLIDRTGNKNTPLVLTAVAIFKKNKCEVS